MNAMFVKYAGPLTKLITSQRTSSPTSRSAIAGMTYEPVVRRARRGAVATFVAMGPVETHRGRRGLPRCRYRSVPRLADQARLRDDGLHGNEVLPGLLVDRDRER